MSLTITIDNVSSLSTESVTLPAADKADLVLTSTSVDPKTGRQTAIYTITGVDANHPQNLVVSVDPFVKGAGTRYGSLTFKTWLRQVSSVTDEITVWPIQATVSFVLPSDGPVSLTDFGKLIGAALSYTYASVASGARDTVWLARLLAGSPAVK